MAQANSDNIITQLYSDFERAYAAQEQTFAVYEQASGILGHSHQAEEGRWERSLAECNRIAGLILAAPSKSPDEMLLKIRVAGWRAGLADTLTASEAWQPDRSRHQGEEFHAYLALATLRDDIRRLGLAAIGKPPATRAVTSDKRVSRGQK